MHKTEQKTKIVDFHNLNMDNLENAASKMTVANITKKLLPQWRKDKKQEELRKYFKGAFMSFRLTVENETKRTNEQLEELKKENLVNPATLTLGQRFKLLFTGNV